MSRSNEPLGYDQLGEALARLGLSGRTAEYHGALCGALCVKSPEEVDPMQVLEGATTAAADAIAILRQFSGESLDAFDSEDMGFNPLLPDDGEDLVQRVAALCGWCEGFLYGISTGSTLNLKLCSPELKEILKDFTEFTRAGMDADSDEELEEGAYAELVEYIRVGAQLVYMELNRMPPAEPARKLH